MRLTFLTTLLSVAFLYISSTAEQPRDRPLGRWLPSSSPQSRMTRLSFPGCINRGDTTYLLDGSWYINPPDTILCDDAHPPDAQDELDYSIDWTEPRRLTYFEGDDWGPQASVDDSIIHLIWRHDGGGIEDVFYMRSSDRGQTWSDPVNMSQTGDCGVMRRSIASRSGNAILFWTYSCPLLELRYLRSTNGGESWQDYGRYDFSDGGPVLTYLEGELVILFFLSEFTGDLRFDFTSDWGFSWVGSRHLSDLTIGGRNTDAAKSGTFIHLGVGDSDSTRSTEIFYHRSTDLGQTWSIDNLLTPDDGIPSQWPDNAAHDRAVQITWFDSRYGGTEIMAMRSTDNGATWEDGQRLSYSHVAMDSRIVSGDAGTFVVWNDARHSDSINTEIYLRASFDDGATWEPEERVTFAVGASAEPYIVLVGNVIYLFWIDTRDGAGSYEVYFQKGEVSRTEIHENALDVAQKGLKLSCFPNPFNSSATITVDGYGGGDRVIGIYDIRGALVRKIGLGKEEQKATWDATDNSGQKVCSGLYFARVETPQGKATAKLLLLR